MIKELHVEHWKSFEKATLYIDPLTILIGPNASGKSNLLDALFFLQRIGSGADIDEAVNGSSVLPPLRGGAAAVCRKPSQWLALEALIGEPGQPDCRYRIKVWTDGVSATAFEESLVRVSDETAGVNAGEERLFWTERVGSDDELRPWVELSPTVGEIEHRAHVRGQFLTAHWKTESGEKQTQGVGISRTYLQFLPPFDFSDDFLDSVQRVRANLERIFVFDPIPGAMRDVAALSNRLDPDGSNIAGVIAALDAEHKEALEKTLTDSLRGLPERDVRRVWAQRLGVLENDAMLYCEEGWAPPGEPPIDARTMSDGTLRYLAIIAAMLVQPQGSLVVIEDVDNGLHPSRARLLIDMLRTLGKEREIDVLATTHNPALIDAAGVRMLPFITVAHRDEATGASRLTPLEDIEQLPKLLAGGSLGQLATAGRIQPALAVDGG